ncbi:elongation of very long chain fatty acids protein 4-like [Daktulosphaira vitifoliae]|uniref:elongation of very long chain fatty acids protein 4-like n=1 Tax=Daktulosphaira vitifoliae TaxID=58002 RepID=UPI0021AA3C31|nr:elongation of very long chain fatty acids protein 4-like [Daktulosphaira vitifoliae]
MANITYGSLEGGFFNKMIDYLIDKLEQEIHTDELVDSWSLMKTPWPILFILAIYLLFILKIGPKIMEKRKPLNLKYIMMAYNLMQMIYNFIFVTNIFQPELFNAMISTLCRESSIDFHIRLRYYSFCWYFMFSKVLDLIDTVFFVLRKKQSHVSFLHVYHHVNMVISIWLFCKFFRTSCGAFVGLMNAFVHAIMYSYYFLSAFGPIMQKYLWWKKYLTRLQIVQFIIGLTYGFSLFIFDCEFPRLFTIYMIVDVSLFLYLFLVFYKKTYSNESKLK